MPESWIALSDCDTTLGQSEPGDLLPRGTFILELSLPLIGPVVLLDHTHVAPNIGQALGFSVFHDPDRGLILMQRQGRRLLRHILPQPIEGESGLVRIIYQWDVKDRSWQLSADMMNGAPALMAQGADPVMWSVADMVQLCNAGQRHPAVLWYGVTSRTVPPAPKPWIGQRTPVETPTGPVAAGLLRAGDQVLTADGGARKLRSVRHMRVPGRGAFAPVLLRAPYFGSRIDLLVSSEQAIGLQGTSVEYLYGEDRVLAAAHHMADGIAAFADNRRAVITGVSLDFGSAALIMADGCMLMSDTEQDSALPARLLHKFEVTPLLAMQARSGLRPVA
ncbi:MAG: Hint domain-containing protein [Paracoccaceae bacterium]